MSRVTNRQLSPEEARRQELHVAIAQEAPETMLNLLTDIVENEDWRAHGMSFLQYIETPYGKGGVGWTRRNLKAIIHFEHRKEIENVDQEFMIPRLKTMREFIAHELEVEIPVLNGHGGNREQGVITPSDVQRGSGNRDYIISRLKRDGFNDLVNAVINGEISASEAAIQAGYNKRKVAITVTDPTSAAQTIIKYMEPDALKELLAILAEEVANHSEIGDTP